MIDLKRSAKFFSIILAILLVFSPILTVNAAAVSYPEGVTKEQAASVIPKLNNLAKALLSSGSSDISTTLYKTLFDDSTLNSLFSGIYTALGENADALSAIGVDISPAALAEHLDSYESISKKVASCKNIDAVIKASKNFKWEVNSKKTFENALAAMMAPFNALLNALLCSGSVEINSLIAITGDDGYANAIVPLLKALDCPDIMSSSEFSSSAAKNHKNIIRNIADMLFLSIDALLADPVIGMCKTLPKIAYYIKSGKLSASITSLLEPLSLKIAGFLTIPGISDLISGVANLEGSFNIEEMLGEFDLSSMLGSDTNITLPTIDLQALADCVTDNGSTLTSDQADAFIVILNLLADTLRLNKDSIDSLLGGDAAVGDMLTPLLSKTNDEIIKSIINLFSIGSVPANNYQWVYPAASSSAFSYTPVFQAADYAAFLENADPLLTDFVKETDPEGTIEDTLRKTIYSNSLISTLLKEVFSMLASEDTAPLLALLGMDVSPAGIANAVYSYVPGTANYLYNFYSWEKVNPEYLAWGFEDGDSEGFTKALTRILKPFTPLLSCLLAGQNVTLMGAVTIPGADGYNTAMIPLLEAVGCSSDSIKTYEEYKKGAGTDAVISDLLTPLCSLLDEVCASPIKTVCRILPNIVYFFNSGLMNSFIENLLYPVKAMLETAGMGDMLTSVMSSMPETDLNSMVSSLTSGTDLGIALPEFNISDFGTLGTLTSHQSKRVYNGAYANYSYLESDSPAVFLSIMRYVTSIITMEENSNLLTGLMGSAGSEPSPEGTPDMFAMFASNIGEKFKGMTADETVEWLCDLLFSDSPIKELPVDEGEPPTIIYQEKFELSTTAKLVIVVVVIALLALVYYILSVSGKLDKLKLKYRKKQELKRREKEAQQLKKAGGIKEEPKTSPSAPITAIPEEKTAEEKTAEEKSAGEATDNAVTAAKASNEKTTSVPPRKTGLSAEERANLLDALIEETEKKKNASGKNMPDNLDRRQQSALKKSYKNQLKAQKIYEKAVKQAAKKK